MTDVTLTDAEIESTAKAFAKKDRGYFTTREPPENWWDDGGEGVYETAWRNDVREKIDAFTKRGWTLTPPGEQPPAVTVKRRTLSETLYLQMLVAKPDRHFLADESCTTARSLYVDGLIALGRHDPESGEYFFRITPAGQAVLDTADAEFEAAGEVTFLDEQCDSLDRPHSECVDIVGDEWDVSEVAREPQMGERFWDSAGYQMVRTGIWLVGDHRFILTPKAGQEGGE